MRRRRNLLPPNNDWVWDAKCYREGIDQWETRNVMPQSSSKDYWDKAEEKCAGCPVIAKCAAQGVYYRDVGVIMGGIPLLDSKYDNEEFGLYVMLERVARGEPRGEPVEPLPETLNTLIEDIPSRTDPTPFHLGGLQYVSIAGAAEILGVRDRQFLNLRSKGGLVLTDIQIRRVKRGMPNIYFLVDEVHRAKEKLEAERDARREQRRAQVRENTRKWRAENPERSREINRDAKRRNPEKNREAARVWRERNRGVRQGQGALAEGA